MWHRAWLIRRKGKGGMSYAVRWFAEDGRMRTEATGTDKRLAEQQRREKELKLNTGQLNEHPPMRLSEFIREHLGLIEKRVSPGTLAIYRDALNGFAAHGGDKMLDKVTVTDCERFYSMRLEKVKPATANKERRSVRTAFQYALKRGYLDKNPWDAVTPVREPEKELRVLSHKEVELLLDACHNVKWKALVFMAVSTGLRRGELLHLEWNDLDFEDGLLRVVNKSEHATKSKRNRVVALVPEAVELLKELRRQQFGRWVFMAETGERLHNNVTRDFDRIVTRAGIKRCTLHDLRRTFVSHLAMAGVNEAVAQRLAGHASIQTTLKHYTSIFPEVARQAAYRLPWVKKARKSVSNSSRGRKSGGAAKTA